MSTSRVLAGVAVMLIVFAAVILGGVYYMLTQFGDELDSELDTQVQTVQRDFDGDVRRLQRNLKRELRSELDARLPPVVTTGRSPRSRAAGRRGAGTRRPGGQALVEPHALDQARDRTREIVERRAVTQLQAEVLHRAAERGRAARPTACARPCSAR